MALSNIYTDGHVVCHQYGHLDSPVSLYYFCFRNRVFVSGPQECLEVGIFSFATAYIFFFFLANRTGKAWLNYAIHSYWLKQYLNIDIVFAHVLYRGAMLNTKNSRALR